MPPRGPATKSRRRIYPMRHGDVRYFDEQGKHGHPKFVDLTDDGRAQAAAMGGGLGVAGGFEQNPGHLNIIDVDVEDDKIQRRVIKLINPTPMNYSKPGNNPTSPEQIFEYRRMITARLKDS